MRILSIFVLIILFVACTLITDINKKTDNNQVVGKTYKQSGPTLLFGTEDIPALKEKLGEGTLSGSTNDMEHYEWASKTNSALESLLRGQKNDVAIKYLMIYVNDPKSVRWEPGYALIYDFQNQFMTAEQRELAKERLLEDAENTRLSSLPENHPMWYFREGLGNNWLISHMTDYAIQRMLFPAILFPEDERSPACKERAIELLKITWLNYLPGKIDGKAAEMDDETLTSPSSYGLYNKNNFSSLLVALKRNTNFNLYEFGDKLFENEGIYRTYILGSEEIEHNRIIYNASYVGAGHDNYRAILYYSNKFMLHYAKVYNNPVLAWHYYVAPTRISNVFNNKTPIEIYSSKVNSFHTWEDLMFWGEVEPKSPADLNWPLFKHFEGAGAVVIRKSWEKKGPGSGLIWLRAGYGGSHYQPSQGTVIYHADNSVILGNAGSQNYSASSLMNNVILIDGKGQFSPYPNVDVQRRKYGTITKINNYSYILNASKAYEKDFPNLNWERKVTYDPTGDILEIIDTISNPDNQPHSIYFNWVTESQKITDTSISLPANYMMTIENMDTGASSISNVEANKDVTVEPRGSTPNAPFKTLGITVEMNANSTVKIRWIVRK